MTVSGLTLKAATRRLVDACGGQEACALVKGMDKERHQHFSEVGLPRHEKMFLRVDRIALLEADCGEPIITRELARATGHILVREPRPMAAEAPTAALISIMRENGDLLVSGMEAAADGEFTPEEVAALIEKGERALEAVAQLLTNLRGMRE